MASHLRTGQLPSVNADRFSMVPRADVPRSAFDIRHTHKTTFDAGLLIPIFVEEVLPGDSMSVKMTAFARLATPIVPFMDNLLMETHFFFTPCRLLWDNWQRMMGEKASTADTTAFLVPYIELSSVHVTPNTVFDYMGITIDPLSAGNIRVNALPFRAYNLIWNEWFRDQELQNPLVFTTNDGPDLPGNYVVNRRGKRHDYFTSARPFPQSVMNSSVPTMEPMTPGENFAGGMYNAIAGQTFRGVGAPVSGIGVGSASSTTAGPGTVKTPGSRTVDYAPFFQTANTNFIFQADGTNGFPMVRVLVNDLRRAAMVQSFMEKNSRGGSRYTEIIRSHFGVVSPDGRLQRPEYLGGGKSWVAINPVAQTAPSDGTTTVLAELGAVGTVMGTDHGFQGSFTEHGYIIGMVSIRSDLTYQQGVRRMWFRRSPFDFYWPAFAHLGEQAILRKEIYVNGVAGSANDDAVFGYQERWAEYKYHPSRTSGFFRSWSSTPLDMWHLAQQFVAPPALNSSFIADIPPMDRVLQVDTVGGQEFLFDSLFTQRMVRPMPMFSVPGFGPRI